MVFSAVDKPLWTIYRKFVDISVAVAFTCHPDSGKLHHGCRQAATKGELAVDPQWVRYSFPVYLWGPWP